METFLEYLMRKINKTAPDKSKMLFPTRIKEHIFFKAIMFPYKLLVVFKNSIANSYQSGDLQNRLALIQNAIVDPQGLGGLDLKLHNAHIPQQYYDIFYKLPFIMQTHRSQVGGGQQR